MIRRRWGPAVLASLLLVCPALAAQAQAPPTTTAAYPRGQRIEIRTPVGQPLSSSEKERIVATILAHPSAARVSERRRTLRVTLESAAGKEEGPARDQSLVARAIIFDYATNAATRFDLDLATGEVTAERLRGRPQPSEEEIAEAREILRAQPDLRSKLEQGAVLEGGFAVDPPAGTERTRSDHRMLQLLVLSRDRKDLLHFVTIDLTAREVAAVEGPRVPRRY